jgi:hypothetical protein
MDYKLLLLLACVLALQLCASYVRADDANVVTEEAGDDAGSSSEPAGEDLSFENDAKAKGEKHTVCFDRLLDCYRCWRAKLLFSRFCCERFFFAW